MGKVTGKPAMIILSRGGKFSDKKGSANDFQLKYLHFYLNLIGFIEINEVIAEE